MGTRQVEGPESYREALGSDPSGGARLRRGCGQAYAQEPLGSRCWLSIWFLLRYHTRVTAPMLYSHAPLVLVALEVRHPPAALSQTEARSMKKLLSDELPIERSGQLASVPLLPGGSVQVETEIERFPRFLNRESTVAVSARREATVIEASQYPGWPGLLELAARALDARAQIAAIDGIERIGLRYINEVRIPGDDAPDWSQWVHRSLLAPESTEPIGLPLNSWQGIGLYGSQPGQLLVMRYGPRVGFAVDPNSDLRRITSHAGPFFLIDIDSSWTPDTTIPEYEPATFVAKCKDLHRPVHKLFRGIVTDSLKDKVFSNA